MLNCDIDFITDVGNAHVGRTLMSDKVTQEGTMKITNEGFLLRSSILVACVLLVGCNRSPNQNTSAHTAQASAKHYQLKGKVVSIDKQGKMVNLDSETIPGYMDAMTMPYQVKPEGELDKLHPGDKITADLTVQDDGAWLENISISGHTDAPVSK
jgi:Cu/Ag efflux protein CusF